MRALLLALATFFLPATAFAGDCPVCETAASCNRPGLECSEANPCFCVQWDTSPGCGALTRLCCPGQGCNNVGGRPSCEGDRCTVVDGPYTGGDAGAGRVDAGSPADAGGGTDAGAVDAAGRDSGTSARDAGVTTGERDDGCGCSTSESIGGGLASMLVVAFALYRRRR
jgi:MYXO-CTERM domain-containing protein